MGRYTQDSRWRRNSTQISITISWKKLWGAASHALIAVAQQSEKLWGAASHALIAVAQLRNLPHGSHRALKNAAQLLADETGDVALLLGFVSSEKFHANFYIRRLKSAAWSQPVCSV
jgi:hypothetical protein